jgi:hypothetical protein
MDFNSQKPFGVKVLITLLKRRREICFSHRGRPDSANDDIVSADDVDDFPSPINQLVPPVLAQFIEESSSVGMLYENLRSLENAKTDL